jgi:hypothetical protein
LSRPSKLTLLLSSVEVNIYWWKYRHDNDMNQSATRQTNSYRNKWDLEKNQIKIFLCHLSVGICLSKELIDWLINLFIYLLIDWCLTPTLAVFQLLYHENFLFVKRMFSQVSETKYCTTRNLRPLHASLTSSKIINRFYWYILMRSKYGQG